MSIINYTTICKWGFHGCSIAMQALLVRSEYQAEQRSAFAAVGWMSMRGPQPLSLFQEFQFLKNGYCIMIFF
jgi:hypothetical protein